MNSSGFTYAETIPYVGLVLLIFVVVINNYRKGAYELWSPLTIIFLIFSYYCILGPYQAVSSGKTFDRLVNMRQFYTSAFWGALVSLLSTLIGFQLNNKVRSKAIMISDQALGRYGYTLYAVGFLFFTISVGGSVAKLINPLDAEQAQVVGGSLSNYMNLCLNFLIPSVTILFAYYLRTRKGLLWLILLGFIATGLFITIGFRYRVVLLLISMAITYYLMRGKRPNPILALLGIFLFILAMGIMDKTRKYGSGLTLENLNREQSQSNLESGLNESKIFQTSGAILDLVPERIPYAGFTPIISTLLFPIPRALYPGKDSGEYLFHALDSIYGKKFSRGAAILCYAEYFLAFGWFGIFLGGFSLGWFYKNLWTWYKMNNQNPMVIVTYAVTVSYLYMIISRGYLPQVTMLFFFSVFPVYIVWMLIKRRHGSIANIKKNTSAL